MSLDFSAGGAARVDVGSGASLDDLSAFTIMGWAYPTSTTNGRIFQKGTSGTSASFRYVGVNNVTGLEINVDRATTDTLVNGAFANFAAWGLNKWIFFAFVYDSAGANGDQKIYCGDLSTLAAEPSAYGSQIVGSGAVQADATVNGVIGNNTAAATNFKGRIHHFAIANRALSRGEILNWQFRPRMFSGCVGLWRLGYAPAASTQPDMSGNGNAGTVTTAVLSAPSPIRVWASAPRVPYVVSAPAATTVSRRSQRRRRTLMALYGGIGSGDLRVIR